ncbi:hypothetical protein D3C85_848850 [compost metagenome]
MTNQLPALVALSSRLIACPVVQTLRTDCLAIPRLLEQRREPQLIVVLHTAPGTSAVPAVEQLTGFAKQAKTQPRIDADRAQNGAAQTMDRTQVGWRRSQREQARIRLVSRTPSRITEGVIDSRVCRIADASTVIFH